MNDTYTNILSETDNFLPDEVRAYLVSKSQNPFVVELAYEWLAKKTYKASSTSNEITQLVVTKPLDPFFIKFVDTYWSILPPSFSGNRESPILEIAFLPKNVLGVYDANDHKISIAPGIIPDTPKSLDGNHLLNYISNEARALIGISNPASVIIHELTHAILRNTHHQGHNDLTLIFPGKPETTYTFDEATNVIYKYVLTNGLLSKLK